jgi:UTP:GlnB (protein PII) uridylyltransferase
MDKPVGRGSQPPGARVAHAAALQFRRLVRGAPRVTIEDHGTYTSIVHLEGVFTPGWVGSLAAGLAEHGVSIVRGFAEADPFDAWEAELVIERASMGAMPVASDVVRMADRDVRDYSVQRIELSGGSASRVPDHGGSLLVIVEGQDQIGLLASVLTRLAEVALFPVEIAVSTTGGRAADRLWLRAAGHREPRPEALHAVSLALHPVLGQPDA